MNRYLYQTFTRPKIIGNFIVGDRVKYASALNPVREVLRGTITNTLSPFKVRVRWDNDPEIFYPHDLDEWKESLTHE